MICKASCVHNIADTCELCESEIIGIKINMEGYCDRLNDYDEIDEIDADEEGGAE